MVAADHDPNRQRLLWLLALLVVLVLVASLLFSLLSSLNTVERQSVQRYQQQWQQQVAYVHGLWLTQSRPEWLRLRMASSLSTGKLAEKTQVILINMNKQGWPIANSPEECLQLWEQLLGSALSQASTEAVVDYTTEACSFQFLDLGHIEYRFDVGRVSVQWL